VQHKKNKTYIRREILTLMLQRVYFLVLEQKVFCQKLMGQKAVKENYILNEVSEIARKMFRRKKTLLMHPERQV